MGDELLSRGYNLVWWNTLSKVFRKHKTWHPRRVLTDHITLKWCGTMRARCTPRMLGTSPFTSTAGRGLADTALARPSGRRLHRVSVSYRSGYRLKGKIGAKRMFYRTRCAKGSGMPEITASTRRSFEVRNAPLNAVGVQGHIKRIHRWRSTPCGTG